MKFKVGDRVRYNREFLVDRLETGNGFRYTGIEGFNIIEISEKEVKSEDGFWFYKDQLELIPEEPEFQQGEEVEVSRDDKRWEKRIYLTTINLYKKFYICVSELSVEKYNAGLEYNICECPYARKCKPQLTRKEIAEKFGIFEDFVLID